MAMGCDIHIRIERQNGAGVWERVPYIEEHWKAAGADDFDEYDRQRVARIDAAMASGAVLMPRAFTNRDYDLFGILADVRNGSGFAGIYTGAGWPSVAASRGIPEDSAAHGYNGVSPEAGEYDYDHWLGDHSYTWITLDELRAIPWDTLVSTNAGWVAESAWRAVVTRRAQDKDARPTEWCGDIIGPGIRKISEAEAYRRLHANLPIERDKKAAYDRELVYVRSEWQVTARAATNDWAGKVLPVLERVADGQPLRLVMGFDS